MIHMLLRMGCAAVIAAGILSSSGSAQVIAAPAKIQIILDIDFVNRSGQWSSSGAFIDQGIIADVAKHDPNGRGTISVRETLSGDRVTFTWKFTRNFSFTPIGIRTAGAWQMISGTGAYSGITGQGSFEGVMDPGSGQIHDVFSGHVSMKPCRPAAGTGVEVCSL